MKNQPTFIVLIDVLIDVVVWTSREVYCQSRRARGSCTYENSDLMGSCVLYKSVLGVDELEWINEKAGAVANGPVLDHTLNSRNGHVVYVDLFFKWRKHSRLRNFHFIAKFHLPSQPNWRLFVPFVPIFTSTEVKTVKEMAGFKWFLSMIRTIHFQ